MRRTSGIVLVILGVILAVAGGVVAALGTEPPADLENRVLWKAIVAAAIVTVAYGFYLLTARLIAHSDATKRRRRGGQRVKNELYTRGLERFNEHPDGIAFPVSRVR